MRKCTIIDMYIYIYRVYIGNMLYSKMLYIYMLDVSFFVRAALPSGDGNVLFVQQKRKCVAANVPFQEPIDTQTI